MEILLVVVQFPELEQTFDKTIKIHIQFSVFILRLIAVGVLDVIFNSTNRCRLIVDRKCSRLELISSCEITQPVSTELVVKLSLMLCTHKFEYAQVLPQIMLDMPFDIPSGVDRVLVSDLLHRTYAQNTFQICNNNNH